MTAWLKFDLNDPSDKERHRNAVRAIRLNDFIDGFYEKFLRTQKKYAQADGDKIIDSTQGRYISLDFVIEQYFQMQADIISDD